MQSRPVAHSKTLKDQHDATLIFTLAQNATTAFEFESFHGLHLLTPDHRDVKQPCGSPLPLASSFFSAISSWGENPMQLAKQFRVWHFAPCSEHPDKDTHFSERPAEILRHEKRLSRGRRCVLLVKLQDPHQRRYARHETC